MSAELYARVQILRRFAICIGLLPLFVGGWRWWGVHLRLGRSNVSLRNGCRLRSGCRAGDFFLRNLLANLALGRKQAPVGDGKTFLLLFSHRLSLQHLQVYALEYL